jgi:hypothetical protein
LSEKPKKEPLDFEKWWERKKEKYHKTWKEHPNPDIALAVAVDEHEYRAGELRSITQRTTLYLTIAGLTLAAYGLVPASARLLPLILAKVGMVSTGIALVVCLIAFMPPLGVWRKRFQPADQWAKMIKTPFDQYAQALMRADRKTGPLERYKRLHSIAVPSLITAVSLMVAVFLLR